MIQSTDLIKISPVLHALVCVCVCVCVVIRNVVTCVDSCDHHHSQDIEQFHHRDPLCYPFIAKAISFPAPTSLSLGNHSSILQLYNFVISEMLYKWNHTVCYLLRLAFLTQHHSLEIHSGCCVSIFHSFLLLSSIPWYGCTIVCSTI